ncbi:hypothetical protein VP01_2682g4 [Puccinia sorghi]|uniref:FAD synthase n=1 Tax=Puccinia sorghi TaxID=27349 RepID=A0A0L6V3T1_9BASI|nr:hypothetical protein VP01_2682g4 [Puccinia sorghi]
MSPVIRCLFIGPGLRGGDVGVGEGKGCVIRVAPCKAWLDLMRWLGFTKRVTLAEQPPTVKRGSAPVQRKRRAKQNRRHTMTSKDSLRRRFGKPEADRVYQLAHAEEPTQLSLQIKRALEIIELAIVRFGADGLSISFNGGKDSTVLVHLFAAALHRNCSSATSLPESDPNLKLSGLYIRCQSPFTEVDEFVNQCQEVYNIDLMTVDDSLKSGLGAFLAERPSIQAILIGTRATDPNGGCLTAFDPTDSDWPSIIRVHPILDWHYSHVWQFLQELEVDWCTLYNSGYTSLGSSFNTYKNPFLQTDDGWKAAWDLSDGRNERADKLKYLDGDFW